MAYQVQEQDMDIALRYLRKIEDQTPADQRSVKIYHECPNSYSLYDLMSEVEKRTNFGRRWVGDLVSDAQDVNQDLESYLKGSMK